MFQSYDWLYNWQSTIGAKKLSVMPVVLVVANQDVPVALFPFGMRRKMGIRIIEFLGDAQSDYNTPLVRQQYQAAFPIEEMWRLTEKHLPAHDVRVLKRIPAKLNRVADAWLETLAATYESEAYSFDLPRTVEDFERELPSRWRADSKRQMKRLSSSGQFNFCIAALPSEHREMTREMIAQKRARYRQTGVRDTLSSNLVQEFYLNFFGKFSESGAIQVSSLQLDGKIIAAHWGAIYRDRYYWLMPSYADGGWQKFSPGRLLLENIIRWAIENDLKVFDFTVGNEQYKNRLSDKTILLYRHSNFYSIGGMIFLYISHFLDWLKKTPTTRNLITKSIAGYRNLFKLR